MGILDIYGFEIFEANRYINLIRTTFTKLDLLIYLFIDHNNGNLITIPSKIKHPHTLSPYFCSKCASVISFITLK